MATYYISPQYGDDSANGLSTSNAWKTINHSNNFNHQPGDIIEFVGNDTVLGWNEYIHPKNSGTANNPIIYRCEASHQTILANNNYSGHTIRLDKNDYDDNTPRNYITIQGFKIVNKYWGRIDECVGITIENCECMHYDEIHPEVEEYYGGPYWGVWGFRMQDTSYSIIRNNTFYGCQIGSSQDILMMLDKPHHNLIEDNVFVNAGHTLISIRGNNTDGAIHNISDDSRFNIIRNNYMYNEYHQAVNIHVGGYFNVLDSNVVERAGTGSSHGEEYKYRVMDGSGNELGAFTYTTTTNAIVRNNIVQRCGDGQIETDQNEWYTFGAVQNTARAASISNVYTDNIHPAINNHFYNNVFYKNWATTMSCGLGIDPEVNPANEIPEYKNHVYKNNIFYKNGENGFDLPGSDRRPETDGLQDMFIYYDEYGYPASVKENWNDKWSYNLMEDVNNNKILLYGSFSNNNYYNLSEMEAGISYLPSTTFENNIQGNPLFSDSDSTWDKFDLDTIRGKFALTNGSPAIEAGGHLTFTTNSGTNSTSMSVDDPYYFMGGSNPNNWDGIIPGDTIQVGNTTVIISSIDYTNKVLTLNTPISWVSGDKVSLPYSGVAPNMGLTNNILAPVVGPVYYIDATNGNDSNDGLTVNTAWKTISKVNTEMGTFMPGDSVLFKRGETFSGDETLSITAVGTANNYIVFGAYGTGNKPILTNYNSSGDYRFVITSNYNEYIKITDLDIRVPFINGVSTTGIQVRDSGNIEVSYCKVSSNIGAAIHTEVTSFGIAVSSKNTTKLGVNIINNEIFDLVVGATWYIDNDNTSNEYLGGEFSYNTIYDCYTTNLATSGGEAFIMAGYIARDYNYDLRIAHNHIYNYGGNALDLTNVSSVLVEFNTFENPKDIFIQNSSDYGGAAIKGGGPYTHAHIIRYNTFNNITRTVNRNENCVGISTQESSGGWIYGNLFNNIGGIGAISINYYSNGELYYPDEYYFIHSNTIIHNPQENNGESFSGAGIVQWGGAPSQSPLVDCRNNVVFTTDNNSIVLRNTNYCNNNVCDKPTNNINTSLHPDVFNDNTGQWEGAIEDYTSATTDIFRDYNNNDFVPKEGSILINAAQSSGYDGNGIAIDSKDIQNYTRDNNPDVGAFEYAGTNSNIEGQEPSNLYTTVEGSTIRLFWTDNSSDEQGFEIRKGNDEYIASVGINQTTYTIIGATIGIHTFKVRTFGSFGYSLYSDTATAIVSEEPSSIFKINNTSLSDQVTNNIASTTNVTTLPSSSSSAVSQNVISARAPGKGGGGPVNPPTKRTANGLNADALAALFIKKQDEINFDKFAIKNSEGKTVDFDSYAARLESHNKMAEALNEYIKKECYVTGTYSGVLSAGGPDKVGLYDFEVESCTIKGDVFMSIGGTTHREALNGYQFRLGRAIESSVVFKSIDATSYLTGTSTVIASSSININIPSNDNGEIKTRESMMKDLANAIIDGIHASYTFPTSVTVGSTGPGSGTWIFGVIN